MDNCKQQTTFLHTRDRMLLCGLTVLLTLVTLQGSVTSRIHRCEFNQHSHLLDCRSRGLSSVPTDEVNFNNAIHIDLSFNKILIVRNRTFVNVKSLKSLDLSNNAIYSMESSAFIGLGDLVSLNLSANNFTLTPDIFTTQLFESLVNLREIQIQNYRKTRYMKWKGIDQAFSKLKSLSRLLMDFPKDFTFQSGFRALSNLTTVLAFGKFEEVGNCNLGNLTNTTFEGLRNSSVHELRLCNCGITSIETNAFEPLKSLSILDLTWNNYLGLQPALRSLYSLRNRTMSEIHLVMLNNELCKGNNYRLEQADFVYLKTMCVKTIDMSQNFISSTDNDRSPKVNLSCIEHLNMSFHSFRCFPEAFLLPFLTAKRLKTADFGHAHSIPNPASYTSMLNIVKGQNFYPFLPVPRNLESLNISGVCYRFFLGKVQFVQGSNMRTIDLSNNNIDNCDALRIHGLENLTHLDISGTICDHIPPEFFSNFRKLKKLFISNSPSLKSSLISRATPFILLDMLEEIDLSANKLSDLNPHLFDKNKHLQSMNLANNKFQRLPAVVSGITQLRHLDLSFNAFTYLLPQEMSIIDRCLTKDGDSCHIALDENPLQCTCESVLFIRWIFKRKQYLDKNGNYTCALADGTQVSVLTFHEGLKNFEVTCISHTYLIISVVGSLSVFILVLFLAAMYRYRINIKYWFYSKLQPPDNMFAGKEYSYDAFVAYTEEDYLWVSGQLRPKMELTDDPIKLCVHNRDFIPGKPIHENIVDKIRESRKILMIISIDFLRCTYGPLEIEYAGMKCVEEGKDDIILCVLMEDIPVRQMPSALRNLWHKITFLKWKDEPNEQVMFWQRLKEALR